jgi:tetratricopeptide (TPR) repeat protein
MDDVQKTIAQSWLLMNKRPDESRIAEWVAWFLTVHSVPTEASILAAKHATLEPIPSWLHNLKGFVAATSGQLDEAEDAFGKASSTGGDWRLAANLALVAEKKRQYGKALERYGIASSLKPPPADAARIQLRIARTMVSLGMRDEAVKALEYGLYLDPLNGDLRYELKKATVR